MKPTLSFQTRQLLIIVFIAAAAVILFSLFLSNEYAKEAETDIQKIADSQMEHIYQNTDYTMDYLRIFGLSIYQDEFVYAWLVSDKSDPVNDSYSFNALRRYMRLQPFISNIYLINNKSYRTIDANTGTSSMSQFEDKEMLHKLTKGSSNYSFFSAHDYAGSSYVALYIPAPGDKPGYAVILFDRMKLENFLFQDSSGGKDFAIQVVNGRNELMMGSSDGFSGLNTAACRHEEERRQCEHEIQGKKLQIVSIPIKSTDWSIYFAMDRGQLTPSIGSFERKMTAACLVLTAILLAVIFWGSRNSLRPFRALAKELQTRLGAANEGTNKEDSEIIRSGVQYLMDSVQQMNTSLRNYKDIAKEEYMRQWILQGSDANIKPALQEISELPRVEQIRLAIIRIESYKSFSEQYNYMSRKLLKYAICNIAAEVAGERGYTRECVDMDGDHLVMLFASPNRDDHADTEMLQHVHSLIRKWLHLNTALSISAVFSHRDNMRKIYDDTYELTLLKFLSGEDKIYSETDLERSFQLGTAFPDDAILHELVRAVKQSNHERTKQLLNELGDSLKNLPLEDLPFQLQMIMYVIYKSFSKVIDAPGTIDSDHTLGSFSSLADFTGWLEHLLTGIMSDQKAKPPNNRKEEIAQEMIDFIQNHLQDPTITLDAVSDHLGLSASYIRHVFKDVYQVTFADYLLEQRLDRVKHLLETTEHTIAEIAEMAGFQTKSHFYSAFKKAEGVTPFQYRSRAKLTLLD